MSLLEDLFKDTMNGGRMVVAVEYKFIVCCSCQIKFAVPGDWKKKKLEDGTGFYCPNGHGQAFTESEITRLEKQLAAKERELAREQTLREQERAATRTARAERDHANNRVRTYKGQVTRIKNRIGNGVCPCCNRHFKDVEAHMKNKHPEFVSEDAA